MLVSDLRLQPAKTMFALMCNDEIETTVAWKMLVAERVPNVCILEKGINGRLDNLAKEEVGIQPREGVGEGEARHEFVAGLGAAHPIADPT